MCRCRFARPVRALLALSSLWLSASVGPAHSDPIVNGGFESPPLTPGAARAFAPGQAIPASGGAWIVVGDPGTTVTLIEDTYAEAFNNVTQFNAGEGLNSVDLSGPFNVGPSAGVRQTVAVTAGKEYTLSFLVGRVTPNAGPGGVYATAATVDVSIDGGPRLHFTNPDIINGRIAWRKFTQAFTPLGDSVTIAFLNGTPVGCNETGFDGVTLVPSDALDVGEGPASLSFAAPIPNPSRGSVTLGYSLARAGHVRLTVFDAAGRRVRLLRDDDESAGAHLETFRLRDEAGRGLANGVYLVRLEAGGRVLARRIAVMP